ncbi:glycosyltransferase [uncultured Eubacterium sp.]|uniref:glycosyltransferase n=1 Tax=uncultured Eubacterium sp. TaxID=165185 RepID=UPI0025FCD2CB|nr:glycosyltransferase [uncultured Eubacterium sp.]
MRICFLAPASNYHTKKWCKWFTEHGHEVHVVSFINDEINNVDVHFIDTGASADSSDSQKLKYLLKARTVKKVVDEINPDIVNVHYATSYGTVAALSGIKNYVLSVWGMDVYDFPQKSLIHKTMLKFSLYRAKRIFSTSKAMAEETSKYTSKKIEVTPFGVDMDLFNPDKRNRQNENEFIVGTVKAITPKYGIDYLLKAVALIKKERPDIPIKLRIAGKGEKLEEYKNLAAQLGIDNLTTWLGFISQEEAAKEWANMDVGVIASTLDSESFGVSAVEAEACETAVIISDIPGLMEATKPCVSSKVIPRCNEYALAHAIIDLFDDENLRKRMGKAGREYVFYNYEVNHCFLQVEKLFNNFIR